MKSRNLISFLLLFVMGACVCAPSARASTLQVGPGKPFAAPCAAIAAANPGDEIDIDSSVTYTGDVCQWSTNNLTIVGVGAGRAVINAGGKNSQGKGIWVISGNDNVVENIEFTGATVTDMNGAGIRSEGINLTIRNCYFHDNQEGILTDGGNSTILIEFSEFFRNGAGDGFSHNLYIGNITHFIFRYNYSHGAIIGHLLKSRAAQNDIYYNRLTDEGTGTASYEIDLPNGGLSYIVGNLIEKGPQGQNNALVSYQEEGANSGNPDHELFVVNNTMVSDYSSQATFVVVDSSVTVPAVIENNIFQGSGTITTQSSATKTTNFSGNALLVSPGTYDYHLQSTSPAVNAGTTPGLGAGVSLAPVFQYVQPSCAEGRATTGSAIDIGAYELNGGNGVPPANAPARCGASAPPAPGANLSTASLTFSNQTLNTTSASKGITLTNNGTASLTISGISASGDFAQTNTCGSSLAAGANCTVSVTFTPTATGTRTGMISITDNATGSPQTVSLTGTGVAAAPAATLAPTSLSFGNQAVGTASPVQTVKLTNGGNATLHITSVTATGDYSQTNNCGTSVVVGASCTISVTFSPTAAGSRSGTISVVDDGPGSPQTVALSGTGQTSASAVKLSPTSLTYSGVLVGTAGTTQLVTLTNTGNAILNVSGITASGDFTQTNNCGTSLAANASCSISVTFKPTLSGDRTGALSIADNAGGSPQTVALDGTGMDFSVGISPSTATIGAGQATTLNVAVTPMGGLVQAVSVTCAGAPTDAACTVASPTLNLNGSSPSSTNVSVTTTSRSVLPIDLRGSPRWMPTIVVMLLLLAVVVMANNSRARRLHLSFGCALLAMVLASGCAGIVKNGVPVPPPTGGTPAGSYTINVTATVAGRAHSVAFTLNVQ